MIGNGKMSLVVLRSWSDGPPKVRAIAPPDNDRSVLVPDHHGRFVTEEVKDDDPRIYAGGGEHIRCASSASQYKEIQVQKDPAIEKNSISDQATTSNLKKTVDGVVYRKAPLQRCFAINSAGVLGKNKNRHSYAGHGANTRGILAGKGSKSTLHLALQQVNSNSSESGHKNEEDEEDDNEDGRPISTTSPDNPDGSSLEYSPPASPVNGRYRNLGPELAATIPKRTVRNSWIAEVKSRWNNKSTSNGNNSTTLSSSRVSSRNSAGSSGSAGGGKKNSSTSNSGTLKSYSSSPSLVYRNKKNKGKKNKGVGKKETEQEGEEDGDYFLEGDDDDDDDEEDEETFKKRKQHQYQHRRSSLQRIHLDEDQEEEVAEQRPFFNPLYKFGLNQSSSSPSGSSTQRSGRSVLRSDLFKSAEILGGSGEGSSRSRSQSNLSNPLSTALSVDDDSQSDRSRSSLGYPPSHNSGNTSYSPSPPLTSSTPNEHIYSSLTDLRNQIRSAGSNNSEGKLGRLDPFKLGAEDQTSSDVVLVEVIRKQNSCGGGDGRVSGEKQKLERFGSVELIKKFSDNGLGLKTKRHSVGDLIEQEVGPKQGGKVETGASPGKVARLKESLKRFGRFGRSNTDKIVRTHSDSGFSTDDLHGSNDFTKESLESDTGKIRGSNNKILVGKSLSENPAEIIVTSLEESRALGITVKPAPRKRSKALEGAVISENIYASIGGTRSSSSSSGISIQSPSPTKIDDEPETKLIDEVDHTKNEKRPTPSEENTTEDNLETKGDDKSRVSPESIPHLEYDKGDTENSTSHDEEESVSSGISRSESLTYSSTSHEQDRSMPQQIVVQQHVIPKVDIINIGGGDVEKNCAKSAGDNDSANSTSVEEEECNESISGGSTSDTLNCEVTPVTRKRSFDETAAEHEKSDEYDDSCVEDDGGDKSQEEQEFQNSSILNKKGSSSSEESDTDIEAKKVEIGEKEEANQEKTCEKASPLPVTLNESGNGVDREAVVGVVVVEENENEDKLKNSLDSEAKASIHNADDVDDQNDNVNSFTRTLGSSSNCKINSREKSNDVKECNGQQTSDLKDFPCNADSTSCVTKENENSNGSEAEKAPEIMASNAILKRNSEQGTHVSNNGGINGAGTVMGKYVTATTENGTASVQVPVQAVNRNVLGFGIANSNNSITSNGSSNNEDSHYNGSIASTTSKNDSEWNRSSLRTSLRGFCEDMLQHDKDKISIPVPDVVEAVINFDEDGSSIEQDDERENSIEYISVSNVKVNREKGLDKLHPRDDIPSCVIALDLGSRGSGYAYWIKEESEFVRIGNVDGGSSCPASHKAPSWVMFDDLYLDGDEDDNESTVSSESSAIRPGFGFQALDKYLTDDAHGQISWRWREHFHEGKSFPFTLDSKASDDDLIFMMKSAIRHYARQAMEQISQRKKGAPLGPKVILIAIPSTFDRRARQLVREAASEAGVLSESDSIALIEDSSATGLYSLHALKSKLNKESNTKVTEMSYLSVDCGAAYLHFSGYQLAEGKLRQLILSRSDPLIDSPESLFEAELSTVFTPNYIFNYQNKYKAGWLKLMTEFENAKNRYDPLSKQNYYVFVPSSFVDHFRRFTSIEIEDALESSDMVWNKTGALGIPHWKMQRFLQPLLDFIADKLVTSMKRHKFDHVVVTGGRAGAKYYIDHISAAAKGFGATLHVPKEYNAAVLQGSTISVTNLAPRLVIRSRFSIGVGVMTPFSEENHPEEKRVKRDDRFWCADVWDSLIKVDQELELNRVIIKRSYVGAQPGQSLLVLPLFMSPDEPKFVTESSVEKCCELKFMSGQRAWQEVELVLVCRPTELLIKAMDGGVMKSYVVVDYAD